jgi:hypothetical protein
LWWLWNFGHKLLLLSWGISMLFPEKDNKKAAGMISLPESPPL